MIILLQKLIYISLTQYFFCVIENAVKIFFHHLLKLFSHVVRIELIEHIDSIKVNFLTILMHRIWSILGQKRLEVHDDCFWMVLISSKQNKIIKYWRITVISSENLLCVDVLHYNNNLLHSYFFNRSLFTIFLIFFTLALSSFDLASFKFLRKLF